MRLKVKESADSFKAGLFGTVEEIDFQNGLVSLSFYPNLGNVVFLRYTFDEVENYTNEA